MDAMRELLDYQSDQIERVLASHGVPGRVYGGSASPRMVEFHVAPAPGVKIARIEGLAEELAMYLGVGSCRIQRRGAVISIEIPKPNPPLVKLLSLMNGLTHAVPPASAVLGQDSEGTPTILRLPSPDVAHVLITGTTGSGKTELARSMILSLALCNRPETLRLLLIDPKSRGYRSFGALPHVIGAVISDVSEAHEKLQGLVAEMERRDRAGESDPRIVVFIDELADLMMVGGKTMVHTMTRLTQRGREAGIHIVACTQKPTAAIVGGLVKSNFPARLVGSVPSADDARIASGLSATGAERLTGRGDFLLVVKGEVHRLQAAFTPENDMIIAITRLAAQPRQPHFALPIGAATALGAPPTNPSPRRDINDDDVDAGPDEQRPVRPFGAAPQPTAQQPQPPPARTFSTDDGGDPYEWRPISEHMRMGSRRAL